MLIPFGEPLPVHPCPCGEGAGDRLVRAWQAPSGRCPGEPVGAAGLCTTDTLTAGDLTAPMTLEMWVTWPDGQTPLRTPAVLPRLW